jgi:hypothetical protein
VLAPTRLARIHGETTVEFLEADDISAGFLFSANHRSTSDRSHPPEACLPGNRPFFVHLNSVDRFTPTTRSTSAVLILWSRWASRSGFGSAGTTVAGRRGSAEELGAPKGKGSWEERVAPLIASGRLARSRVSFEDIVVG